MQGLKVQNRKQNNLLEYFFSKKLFHRYSDIYNDTYFMCYLLTVNHLAP